MNPRNNNLSKERCKDLLIVAMHPFAVVLWVTEGKPRVTAVIDDIRLSEQGYSERCEIVHENALPRTKCDRYDNEFPYLNG